MLKDVKTIVDDGLIGMDGQRGEGVHAKIGVSPVTADVPIIINGTMNSTKIIECLGNSPLADAVMDSVENGANRILCIPVKTDTGGTIGTVKRTGTGTGTITVKGSPTNEFEVILKIAAQGGLNTATFTHSIDGGTVYSDEITIPISGEYTLGNTGTIITFVPGEGESADTAFLTGDTFSFQATAPTMTNADLLNAMQKIKTMNEVVEFVHIVGATDRSLWAALDIMQKEIEKKYNKPLIFICEAYKKSADESISEYVTKLVDDSKNINNYNIQVVAARAVYLKMDGTTREVSCAGIVCGLYAKSAVNQSIGQVNTFSLKADKMTSLAPVGIEEYISELDSARYLTFRKYDGITGFFVTNARVMSSDTSDYRYCEDVRVLNKLKRVIRQEALFHLQSDIDMDDIDGDLATKAKFIQTPADEMVRVKEISSVEVSIPPNQDILKTETLELVLRYVPRGKIREIIVRLGMKRPAAK